MHIAEYFGSYFDSKTQTIYLISFSVVLTIHTSEFDSQIVRVSVFNSYLEYWDNCNLEVFENVKRRCFSLLMTSIREKFQNIDIHE